MKKKLLIIGASGHGKVAADIAIKMGVWDEIYFLDDNIKTKSMGIKVIGRTEEALKYIHDCHIFVAVGENNVREGLFKKIEGFGADIPILKHPSAQVGVEVCIKPGTILMAGAIINSNTHVGKGCIVNTSASVDHDCIIDDFVHISPGSHIGGTVKIGKKTWIGIGSVVKNNITITSMSIIGAGAAVLQDIIESGTYVGVPARKLSR